MDQIGSNGQNRTEVGQSELNITSMDRIGLKGTKVVIMEQIGPK